RHGTGRAFMTDDHSCDEELIRRLPLPLARLYRRACATGSPRERHQLALLLWEASLRLLALAALASYLGRGLSDPGVQGYLPPLSRRRLATWLVSAPRRLRAPPEGGAAGSAAARPVLLGAPPRDDSPRAAALEARLREAGRRTRLAKLRGGLFEMMDDPEIV